MSILEKTANFIELYLYTCGESEVPKVFHHWACISLLAASVSDRVWVKKLGQPLHPNLYTVLLGPSSLGKDTAINAVGRLARDIPAIKWMRVRRTASSLLDKMARKVMRKGMPTFPYAKLFLVMPELGMSIGTGKQAEEFVKYMTALYSVDDDNLDEGTRSHGEHMLQSPCLNWLFGTNMQWLVKSITQEDLRSGFFARTNFVIADYDLNKRIAEPWFPPETDQIKAYLKLRLMKLVKLKGEIKGTNDAMDALRQWYMTREAPEADDLVMIPWWKRQDDMIRKLCVIHAIADERTTFTWEDFDMSLKLATSIWRRLPEVVSQATITPQTEAIHRATTIMRRAIRVSQDILLRRLGVTADHLRIVVATLEQSGMIEIDRTRNSVNPTFIWRGTNGTGIGALLRR